MAEKFIDDDYEPPAPGGNYMKLKDGDNRFRILGRSLSGFKAWPPEGSKETKPSRRPLDDFDSDEVDPKTIKAFLAFPVWNHDDQKVQVLELTQATIIRSIVSLARNKKWGAPYGYDLLVTRSGNGLDTKYSVMPEPREPLDPKAIEAWQALKQDFDLKRLFNSGDPFGQQQNGRQPGEDDDINF